ncbi:hypothetical protein LTR08_001972 [Meristemomyces frigidus]|nr:hypothetical protein LTR08_001972 [Meristemomyces frigidus]
MAESTSTQIPRSDLGDARLVIFDEGDRLYGIFLDDRKGYFDTILKAIMATKARLHEGQQLKSMVLMPRVDSDVLEDFVERMSGGDIRVWRRIRNIGRGWDNIRAAAASTETFSAYTDVPNEPGDASKTSGDDSMTDGPISEIRKNSAKIEKLLETMRVEDAMAKEAGHR